VRPAADGGGARSATLGEQGGRSGGGVCGSDRSGLAALFAGCLLVEVPVPAIALRGVVVAITPAAR
jgi:hypothetical protein